MTALCSGKICTIFPEKGALNFWKACTIALEYSSYRAPENQEVVRVDFHDTDPPPYEQPFNVIPVATERNNLSVAGPMKLSVGSFHLTIPNGTDPQLLAQTLRIVKELEC